MTWNGVHDYKKLEDYTDQEWKKMDPWDNIDAERYWGKNWNYFNRDGGDKDWMKYEQGGGDKVRMWMDLGLGEQRDYQAKHGDNAEEHYTRANAGNFWTLHDPDNLRDYSEEAFFREAPDYIKERYDLNRVAGPRPGISGAGRGVTYTYDPSPGNKYAVGTTRRAADAYQTKQQEAYERSMNLPELPESNDSDSDSEFWDEVDERTPPPEDRNAGDILEIIDAVNEIQDKETPSEFNVNSNSVTSDQTADWKTSINNSGKRAQINADVINDNYIVNRNAFNPDDPTGKAANNFNFNTSDATQDLQWETDITNTGDDAVINAGVYNSLGNFNDNRYGESFSQASDQDSEDVFRYISSSSNEFNPEYTEYTEGNGTNDVSFIRDRNDIGTKFLNQFRSNLFA